MRCRISLEPMPSACIFLGYGEPDTTACPCCAGGLHKIGEDVNEVLDVIPAILRVLRTIRPKYACRGCTDGVVQAKVLPRLIESGMASTALVTHVVVSKFAWYLPLYRQVQILAGQGRAVQMDAMTGQHLHLAIERQVPGELRHHHMAHQRG